MNNKASILTLNPTLNPTFVPHSINVSLVSASWADYLADAVRQTMWSSALARWGGQVVGKVDEG